MADRVVSVGDDFKLPASVMGPLNATYGTPKLDKTEAAIKYTRYNTSPLVKKRSGAAVMSTPPTFTVSATTTLPQNVPTTDPRFKYSGAAPFLKNGAYSPKGSTKLDGSNDVFAGMWRISFDFDGASFEFRTTPQADNRLLIWVDEQPHAAAPIQLSSIAGAVVGTPNWTKVNFGSRARRRVVVELSGDNVVSFNNFQKATADTLLKPSISSPRLVWVGDSQAYGVGAGYAPTSYRDAYPIWAAFEAGIDDVFNSTAQPSAGMVHPIGTTIGNMRSRLVADVLPLNPDILVIQSSVNDTNGWPAYQGQVQTTTLDYINTVKAALPNCRIIVTSPIYAGGAGSQHKAVRDEAKAAALTAGVTFIDAMTDAEPVFTGTGAIDAPTGDGNADYYMEPGGIRTHPNKAGHHHLATWMAGKLAEALKLPY